MSQENVELVRRSTEAWNSGGLGGVGQSGFHGHAGIREVMGGWLDSFDDYRIIAHEIRDLGDQALFLGEMVGKARFFLSWEEALEAAGGAA